jgi:cytidyltransferase-like protein
MREPSGSRTGVYPGTFDPIHNGHLDIIRRATLFDVAEDEHVVAVARLVGAAEPNDPEPNGSPPDEPGGDPNRPEPNSFGSNDPGGGDPNQPESRDGRLEPLGPASGAPDHG